MIGKPSRRCFAPAGKVRGASEKPEKAKIFKSVICHFGGERVMELRAPIRDGEFACIPCSEVYRQGTTGTPAGRDLLEGSRMRRTTSFRGGHGYNKPLAQIKQNGRGENRYGRCGEKGWGGHAFGCPPTLFTDGRPGVPVAAGCDELWAEMSVRIRWVDALVGFRSVAKDA